MKIVVILPTYNEKENISLMIDALLRQFELIPHAMSILVVDDNSPDGTAGIVRAAGVKAPNVFLLTGEKHGLGAAYIRGMKHALNVLHADVVMEMDSDFSHAPEDVPRLIQAIDQGADFVIGSRYVPGGRIPQDWGLLRRMISKWGNMFARYIAGMRQVLDCTAGFRAIRAHIIKQIELDALRVRGYSFQIALLHEAIVQGASVREIAVHFVNRKRGTTKMGFSDIGEFMLNACRIRFERNKTFLKFFAVGASGVAVNLVLLTILLNAGMSKFLASPFAIEISIITNFLLNNYWTFSRHGRNDTIHIRGLKFNIISFAALSVSFSTFLALSALDPRGMPLIHQAVSIVPASLVNYFLNSYWTFESQERNTIPFERPGLRPQEPARLPDR